MALPTVLLEDARNVLLKVDRLLGIGGQQWTSEQGHGKNE